MWAESSMGVAMKRISSPYMSSIKVSPYLVPGLATIVFVIMLWSGAYRTSPLVLIVPPGMAVIAYVQARTSARNLADEVFDCGDSLLVRRKGEEERIPMASIINVNFNTPPSRIRLTLGTPGKFGQEIVFAPPPQVYFGPNPENEVARDLMVRASQARQSARS
jgi:hypothetical protein